MQSEDPLEQISEIQDRLNLALRQLASLKQKAKLLQAQYEDARGREAVTSELLMSLIDRQKELNVILNRTNTMLAHNQAALATSSAQFREVAKVLPESARAEWIERMGHIRAAFSEAGIAESDLPALEWSFECSTTPRVCPRCGKEARTSSAICFYCYASMDSEPQHLDKPHRPMLDVFHRASHSKSHK